MIKRLLALSRILGACGPPKSDTFLKRNCVKSDPAASRQEDYNNGNHYQIQKIGNSTLVNGSNYNNGSSWSQQSTKIGNSTIHTGNAANGNYWNITEQNIGGTKHIIGTDSKGNSVNCMVSQFINTCN